MTTLPDLLTVYRRRREDAERHGSTAAVSQVYEIVIEELEGLELFLPEQKFSTARVASLRDLSQATIRRKCARGEFPGAEKTSGEKGDWRIPASAVNGSKPEPKDRGPARRILDD